MPCKLARYKGEAILENARELLVYTAEELAVSGNSSERCLPYRVCPIPASMISKHECTSDSNFKKPGHNRLSACSLKYEDGLVCLVDSLEF